MISITFFYPTTVFCLSMTPYSFANIKTAKKEEISSFKNKARYGLQCKKLKMNVDKTHHCFCFVSANARLLEHKPIVFLGLTMDDELKWNAPLRLKECLGYEVLKVCYYASFESHMT